MHFLFVDVAEEEDSVVVCKKEKLFLQNHCSKKLKVPVVLIRIYLVFYLNCYEYLSSTVQHLLTIRHSFGWICLVMGA